MKNPIYDGVIINLLQKGPTTGAFSTIDDQFKGTNSVSERYKKSVKAFSIEEFPAEETDHPQDDEHRRLFHWHFKPRIYQVFGFFDLAILQLCDTVEILSELSTQRNISATQNIFGLRTRTGPNGGELHGSLEVCSPLLPYIFICNVKVHPLIQMLFGKELQGILNLHFARHLDEIEVLKRAADPADDGELIALAILDTYGWNELTFLIHGANFERMVDFVWNRIRTLSIDDCGEAVRGSFAGDPELFLRTRISKLTSALHSYGLDRGSLAADIRKIPLFSHTETVAGIDYGLRQKIRETPSLLVPSSEAGFFAAIREDLLKRILKHSVGSKYLGRAAPAEIVPAIDKIIDSMRSDSTGCLSGFSFRPGTDFAFHQKFAEFSGRGAEVEDAGEVVLGQHDFFFRQFREGPTAASLQLLSRLQRIIQLRNPRHRQQQEEALGAFYDLIVSSKTSICSPVVLRRIPAVTDPFESLRRNLPRIFKFKAAAPGQADAVLIESCRRIQLPKSLQISLEHTLEPFYSFLQNPSLFSQYIDLYLPLLLISRQIERAAAGRPDDHKPVAEHVSSELRQFNHAFQARFQASHLNSESPESTLEFKAHTVTPLDTIQCIIDCFTRAFLGFDKIAGFPVISVSSRPYVHPSRVFSVELNSFHLLYPESLVVLFHEMGHLYLQYGERPRRERKRRRLRAAKRSCLPWMFKTDNEHATRRWRAFTAVIRPAENAQPVDYHEVSIQAEEVLSDLLLLTSIFRNDWEVFLWYTLTQIESLSEYFPEDAPAEDRRQMARYREFTMRLFLVFVFWSFGAAADPEGWAREIDFTHFHSFASELRRRSKKIRDFCAKHDEVELDLAAWTLAAEFIHPAESLALSSENGGRFWFEANQDFWALDQTDKIDNHSGLPAMFMSLIFHYYRGMLEDVVVNWLLSYQDDELWEITGVVEAEGPARLEAGDFSMRELNGLLTELITRDRVDPVKYLDDLRAAPSSNRDALPAGGADDVWAAAYRRMTRALYSLIRFFYDENNGVPEEFRYLYRDPRSGEPERIRHGKSTVKASPSHGRKRQPPLAIVIDRRGVFFCRSTRARQQAFQYRSAVIRELADLHYKLRPQKMAEIMKITNSYRKELKSRKPPA